MDTNLTRTAARYFAIQDAHVEAGGIVPPPVRELAAQGRYGEAIAWLRAAEGSDFRILTGLNDAVPTLGDRVAQAVMDNATARMAAADTDEM